METVSVSNKYSLSVLWPGLMPSQPGSIHPGVQAWFSNSRSHPALHSSMLFGSLSHRRTRVSKSQRQLSATDSKTMVLSQIDSISKINTALQDPSLAVTDEIILSVLCLATNDSPDLRDIKHSPFQPTLRSLQWLDIYARLSPNPIHQAGLLRLVELRGGLYKLKLPGLAAVISFSGILSASRSLSRPIFPFVPLQSVAPPTLQDTINIQEHIIDSGPDILLSLQVTEEMHSVFCAARVYVSIVDAYQQGSALAMHSAAICDHRNLLQWQIMSLPPVNELGSVIDGLCPMYEPCRLALIILGVGVVFPLPAETSPLVEASRMLQIALQAYSYSTPSLGSQSTVASLEVLRVYCWCVVLGGIASTGSHERVWFVHELRQVAAAIPVSSWSELHFVLRSILWFDEACSSAGKELFMEATHYLNNNES
ncbi:hypothetical protein BJX68DRAFT_251642 [Aspergillus pseudodeflectus]|uniref:Transcription factor domain-containing protein n=1 Tax=Aspergillus pseudodeflectus TaxID=176178 RepID=A0ABR4LCD5_9EURO